MSSPAQTQLDTAEPLLWVVITPGGFRGEGIRLTDAIDDAMKKEQAAYDLFCDGGTDE